MPDSTLLSSAVKIFLGGVIFVFLSAFIFWPLEELFEEKGALRPKFKDLAALWFYQSYGLWISAGIIFEIAFLIRQFLPAGWSQIVSHQPYWLQAVFALLLAEIWVYSLHRLA